MNNITDRLFSTTMRFNPKQVKLELYNNIMAAKTVNALNNTYEQVQYSLLDDETVLILHGLIREKAENLIMNALIKKN